MLTAIDFKKAYKKFKETDEKYPLLSVGKYRPSEVATIKKNIVKPKDNKVFFKDTKKNSNIFYDLDHLFLIRNFFSNKRFNYYYYELPHHKSIDIDTPEDMKIAEKLYSLKD